MNTIIEARYTAQVFEEDGRFYPQVKQVEFGRHIGAVRFGVWFEHESDAKNTAVILAKEMAVIWKMSIEAGLATLKVRS